MNTIIRTAADSEPRPSVRQVQDQQPYDIAAPDISNADTMRDMLRESIGYYVITQHLIGVSSLVSQEGILVRVAANAFVLREEDSNSYLFCDYFSLKFFRRLPLGVTPGYTPTENTNTSPMATRTSRR